MNPYAGLIVDEARKRGILIDVLDTEYGLFKLSLGSRCVTCRESLSELTSAVAMAKCDDKRLTRKLVRQAGVHVPEQIRHRHLDESISFLNRVGRVVVKPARGEQGDGISVDICDAAELEVAIEKAKAICSDILVEAYVEGQDLRIIVINHKVVARGGQKAAGHYRHRAASGERTHCKAQPQAHGCHRRGKPDS